MELEKYIQTSGPLFEDVQKSSLFSDAKTFTDADPLREPKEIMACYFREKKKARFDLKSFINKHFTLPHEQEKGLTRARNMEDYIDEMWGILEKKMTSPSPYSTLISLPKPHVVPGGRFRECFYWDSYFTALGLLVSGQIERIKNMVINFSFLIERFGFIPNGNRIYFTSRSQPPYFSYLLKMLLECEQEEWALSFAPQLEAEYHFWMRGMETLVANHTATLHIVRIDHRTFLNRYYDALDIPRPEAYKREIALAQEQGSSLGFFRNRRAACASGWDFSSRWLRKPEGMKSIRALDLVPIDLNCLLYHLETTLSDFFHRLKAFDKKKRYALAARHRKEAIQRIFWNREKQFYFDYDFKGQTHTSTWSLAGVFPLFNRIASVRQAEAVSKHLKRSFLCAGGFTTSLDDGMMHQWDHPNGWAPLQWITISALFKYRKRSLAKEAMRRWLMLNRDIFDQVGTMFEKYNVCDCSFSTTGSEYQMQEGFGWTNGVNLALIELQKNPKLKIGY